MDVFYNSKGIGDVLIIPIRKVDRYNIKHANYGDITKILGGNGEIAGYNIFHASKYFDLNGEGRLEMTEGMLEQLQTLFDQNHLNDSLDFDLTPKFVVGYVISKTKHENADKLSVCQVDVGNEKLQIVCGAPNIDQDQKVVVAKVGATLPSGLKIKPTELRGVSSNGMICSQNELDLPNAPSEKGIYILDDMYEIGERFEF